MRFYPAPFDHAEVVNWIEHNRRRYSEDGYGLWAIVLKSSRKLIGDCGLTIQMVEGVNEIEIGYHVRRDHWGQGLATEAARACRDYAFANLGVSRLVSIIRPENIPSRRVAEKNGMTIWKEIMRVSLLHLVYTVQKEKSPAEK